MKIHKYSIFLLITSVLLVYGIVITFKYSGDDNAIFVENTFYRSSENLSRIFSSTYSSSGVEVLYGEASDKGSGSVAYRPVLTLSYFLDYALWQNNPSGYHLTNLLLHGFNVILVFRIISILLDPGMALLTAILFAIFPTHSDAVSLIGFRADLLAASFILLSFLCWIRFRQKKHPWRIFLTSMFYFFGLFTKETAILLPFVVIYYDKYLNNNKSNSSNQNYLLFGIISLFYLWVYFFIFPNTALNQAMSLGNNAQEKISVISQILSVYTKAFLIPFSCIPLPGIYTPLPQPISFSFFMNLLIAGFSIVSLVYLIQKRNISGFLSLWFLLFFLPASPFVPNPNPIAWRYLYIPSIGLFALIGCALMLIWNKFLTKNFSPLLCWLIAGMYFLLCAGTTIFNNNVWKDNFSAGYYWSKQYPDFYLGHMTIGLEYMRSGLYKEAAPYFEKALKDKRCDNISIPYYLGVCYLALGRYSDVIDLLNEYIRKYPNFSKFYPVMGNAYFAMNNFPEANRYFEKACLLNRSYFNFEDWIKTSALIGDNTSIKKALELSRKYWSDNIQYKKLEAFALKQIQDKNAPNENKAPSLLN